MGSVDLQIEFSGGVELLFGKQKSRKISLPKNGSSTLKDLIAHLRDNLLEERPELFVQGESVRPGILVLVNDSDWELVGQLSYEIQNVKQNPKMVTLPRTNRTLIIEKEKGTYGFTLQSYGIKHHGEKEIEYLTYVDFVLENGPAGKSGMKPGDVILSINGMDMEHEDHQTVVNFLQQCPDRIRMVVRFEDCVKKVNLHVRYVKLQAALYERVKVYNQLCEHEKRILSHICQRKQITQLRENKSAPRPVAEAASSAQTKMCRCKCMKKGKSLTAKSETQLAVEDQPSSRVVEISEKFKRFSMHYSCSGAATQAEKSSYAKIVSTKTKKQDWRSQPDIQEKEQYNNMAYGGYGFVYGYSVPKSPKHKPQTLPRGNKRDDEFLEGGMQRTASAGTELTSDEPSVMTRQLKSAEDLLLKQQLRASKCGSSSYQSYRSNGKCWWK